MSAFAVVGSVLFGIALGLLAFTLLVGTAPHGVHNAPIAASKVAGAAGAPPPLPQTGPIAVVNATSSLRSSQLWGHQPIEPKPALRAQESDARNLSVLDGKRHLHQGPITPNADSSGICARMMRKYGVTPGLSWGSLTPAQQQRWTKLNCDKFAKRDGSSAPMDEEPTEGELVNVKLVDLRNSAGIPAVPDEAQSWCKTMRIKHRVRPMKSWGSLTPTLVEEWKSRRCDFVFMALKMSKKPLPDCTASQSVAGTLEMPLIAIMAASTTRRVVKPSISRLALFTYLLPSLMRTLDCGFRYEYVLGYDKGDEFYDTEQGMQEVQDWFRRSIQEPLAARGIVLTLRTVRVNNTVKKPGPVFLEMARAAYAAGAAYFFRVNDDTELVENWAQAFVRSLSTLGPPFGVVGPLCTQGNDKILTHDFVHRTHMEIFEMNYYPPELTDWWMDDWISFVYGQSRTFKASAIPVVHHTGAHGQRYSVDKSHEGLLKNLVRAGRKQIRNYLLKTSSDAATLKRFDADRFEVGFAHQDIPASARSALGRQAKQ